MTTYSYTITVNDSECIALGAAMDFYLAHLEKVYLSGNHAPPTIAHLHSLKAIRERVYEGAKMTSTSSYCYPSGSGTDC